MFRILPVGLLFLVLNIGCQPSHPSPADGPLTVTTTTNLIADLVREVGGPEVSLSCLMGPGVDPHRYSPTPGDLEKLSTARVVFYHGLHLEGKMSDLLKQPRRGVMIVAVAEAISLEKRRTGEVGIEGETDPHVWFDPTLWVVCLDTVIETLAEADPANATLFRTRGQAYRDAIRKADQELVADANLLPAERRVLVTAHDAFGYFGQHYGFTVKGLQGVSTASETSTRDVSELADFLGERKIAAVFAETSVPSKGLEAVLLQVESKYNFRPKLSTGEASLYSDSLGVPGSPGENYLGMIRHNMRTILAASLP